MARAELYLGSPEKSSGVSSLAALRGKIPVGKENFDSPGIEITTTTERKRFYRSKSVKSETEKGVQRWLIPPQSLRPRQEGRVPRKKKTGRSGQQQ